MNSKGVILASVRPEINEDEYEDDINVDKQDKFSYILFKSFTYHYEKCEWEIQMPEGEVTLFLIKTNYSLLTFFSLFDDRMLKLCV